MRDRVSRIAGTLCAVLLLASLGARSETGRADDQRGRMGWAGRVGVRQVETAWRFGGRALKLRVHLTTGLAVDKELREAEDVERTLQLLALAAHGGRVFAEMEGGQLQAVQVSVP